MVADAGGFDSCLSGFSLDHPQGFRSLKAVGAELLGGAVDGAKQRFRFVLADAGRIDILPQINLKAMVAGEFVILPALLQQADPKAVLFGEYVFDVHGQGRADAGERIGHERNQGTIAKVRDSVRRNGAEQVPRFLGRQDRRFAFQVRMSRPAHSGGRVDRDDLAGHKPIEEMAQCGQVLFDGQGCLRSGLEFNPGRDMERPDIGEGMDATGGEPVKELGHGAGIRLAGVPVADLSGEEFEETGEGVFAGILDECRDGRGLESLGKSFG